MEGDILSWKTQNCKVISPFQHDLQIQFIPNQIPICFFFPEEADKLKLQFIWKYI